MAVNVDQAGHVYCEVKDDDDIRQETEDYSEIPNSLVRRLVSSIST